MRSKLQTQRIMNESLSHCSGGSVSAEKIHHQKHHTLKNNKTLDIRVSLRVDPSNPDHHIWNNNGTWWCHYTEHLPDYTKRRVRVSLRTGNVEAARRLRDDLLATLTNSNIN